MLRRLVYAFALTAVTSVLPAQVTGAAELIMVETSGCAYCLRWKQDVGAAEYAATPEGRFAPLRFVDLRDAPPDGVMFLRPVVFTPTFVLVEDGTEIDRIEGYPGEDFFWGLLGMKLKAKTAFAGGS